MLKSSKNRRRRKARRMVILGIAIVFVFAFSIITLYITKDAANTGINRFAAAPLLLSAQMALLIGISFFIYYQQKRMMRISRRANRAKSKFLAHMSHEIRTPISAILGLNEIIMRETSEEAIKRYAGDVKIAGRTLLGLINDVLDFSKIESGKMEIIPVEYEFSSMLYDLLNIIPVKAEEKGLELKYSIDPSIPYKLYGDEIRLKQILLNLLSNAVKYTEKGTVTLSAVCVMKNENTAHIRFSIKDTGIGIREEELARIFTPFERADEKRNRTIEGTGLGISITTQLLELMGSKLEVKSVYGDNSQFRKLEVRSVYGKGSIFSFVIAQDIRDPQEIGDFAGAYSRIKNNVEEYQKSFYAPNARILIVDDTEINLTVMKGLLKQTQIQIETAESGKECLELAAANPYHIIFLDHRMPEMDGIETLRRLIELKGGTLDTPVVALTANAIVGAQQEYINEGFTDYLSKPVDIQKLEAILLKYLPDELIIKDERQETPPSSDMLPVLPVIEGLDVEAGVASCGSFETFQNILKTFNITADERINEIRRFFKAKDYNNYKTKVHALKSSARLAGALELSEMAAFLEQCGLQKNMQESESKTNELIACYKKQAESIGAYFAGLENNSAKPIIENEALLEAFGAIYDFVEAFEFNGANTILEMLNDYTIPPKYNKKIKKLKVLLIDAARDEAMELISEIREALL